MATNASTLAAQARTLEQAARNGVHWTQAELDKLRDLDARGLTDEAIARELNRTLFAIQSAHQVLAEKRERVVATQSPAARTFAGGFTDLDAWERSFGG